MTSVDSRSIEGRLLRFIAEELLEESYDGRDPLATHAVDSLGLEQLAEYIEQEFGVKLSDGEMVEESFESTPVLVALVDSKLRDAAP